MPSGMFSLTPFRGFKCWQTVLETIRQCLFATFDTEKDARLQKGRQRLLVETPGGYAIKGLQPERLALISWPSE
jgi:hypothetical protein